MTAKQSKYFRQKLVDVRNVCSALIEELDVVQQETAPAPSTRKRRNLKDARVLEIERRYATGKWNKSQTSKS